MTERERFIRHDRTDASLFDEPDEPSDEQLPPRANTAEADSDRWAPGKVTTPKGKRFDTIARETLGRVHSDTDLSAPSPVKGLSMREFLTRQVDIARLATLHRRRESAREDTRRYIASGKKYAAYVGRDVEARSEDDAVYNPDEAVEIVDRALTAVPSSLIAIQSIEGGE